jgi:hypothetical protein
VQLLINKSGNYPIDCLLSGPWHLIQGFLCKPCTEFSSVFLLLSYLHRDIAGELLR